MDPGQYEEIDKNDRGQPSVVEDPAEFPEADGVRQFFAQRRSHKLADYNRSPKLTCDFLLLLKQVDHETKSFPNNMFASPAPLYMARSTPAGLQSRPKKAASAREHTKGR